ncbi:uncharacterized protein [Arachis hypogaea]|uniref:uncharacterized protein isoform X2 n=1 Tax=Arachis hypogaea TaxID=3818 RepID=UPI003B220ACF
MSLPHSYSVLTLFFGGGTSTINKHSLMLKKMITSSCSNPTQNAKENPFLYDIVANGRNRIDVDKFDYIVRYCRACGLGCNFQPERYLLG